MPPRKLHFIDSLRGLASLYVLIFHLPNLAFPPVVITPRWFYPILESGGSGVFLFFIVSAFTLSLSMEARAGATPEPVTYFYIRRLFRIAPLFYTWLIIYYFRDIWYYHVVHPWSEVYPSLFFIMNLIPGQEQGYVWASWTIGTEMLFYVFFPFIFRYARNIGIALALFLIALVIHVPWQTIVTLTDLVPNDSVPFYDYSLLFNLSIFMAGIAIYHIYKLINTARLATYGAGYFLITACFALFAWQIYYLQAPDRTLNVTINTLAYGALLLGLVITPTRLIVNRVTRFYGKISYSVYLSHATTIFFMARIFGVIYRYAPTHTLAFALSLIAALAIITPLSYFTYRFIETPGNALGRRLIARMASRRAVLNPI